MDSKKAVNAIIVLLILVNLIMGGYTGYLSYYEQDRTDVNEYVIALLEYRDITVDCDIPGYPPAPGTLTLIDVYDSELLSYLSSLKGELTYDPDMGYVTYVPDSFDRYENIDLDIAVNLADSFLSTLAIEVDAYVLDSILTAGINTYVFKYLYTTEYYHIYDKSIELTVSKNGIEKVNMGILTFDLDDEKTTVSSVSITNILASNFTRKGQSSVVIKKIDTGYIYDLSADSFIVVWRVMYNNGNERYFNAVDGNEVIR